MPPEDEVEKAEPKVAKAETEDTKGRLERLAAITKELFGVLREVSIPICIALFVFLLLFWPETVKDRLHRAGITEVAGVHFDANQLDMAVSRPATRSSKWRRLSRTSKLLSRSWTSCTLSRITRRCRKRSRRSARS